MIDKDENAINLIELFRQCLPYASTLLLSCWGGIVSYIQRMRASKMKFDIKELVFDLVISSFAGLLTYMCCIYSHVGGEMSAVLIAISGHMGTRAIASFERMRDRVFGVTIGQDAGISQGENHDKQP